MMNSSPVRRNGRSPVRQGAQLITVALVIAIACSLPKGPSPARAQIAGSVVTTGQYTLFTQPGAHLSPVLHLIRSARSSIRLEVYLLTSSSIIQELQRAHARGVDVRVLLEERPYGAVRYAGIAFNKLKADGISVRWANESAFTYTHEKSMDVDGTTAGIFTFNLSTSGLLSNREFGLIESNSTDAKIIGTIFDADWNRQTPHVAYSDLVVSPYNSRRIFTAIINSARQTLNVYAEEVDDTSIEGALASAVHRGVHVRLIVPASSAGVSALQHAGVAVKIQPTPYVHAKAFVADGLRFYIGSENISSTSLDKNREMGIELDNRTLAGFVNGTFASDWAKDSGGSSPSPAPTAHAATSTRAGSFGVHVSVTPSNVARGSRLSITATTARGATCSVRVIYPTHYASSARSLQEKETAGSNGKVSWSFVVGTSRTGQGTVSVQCTLHGTTSSGTIPYEVT